MEVAGPLGTPLGLALRKRASPRGEAGTSQNPGGGATGLSNPCSFVMLSSSQPLGGGDSRHSPNCSGGRRVQKGLRQEAGVMGKAGEGGSPLRFLAGE